MIKLYRMLHFIIILYHDRQSTTISGYEPIRLGSHFGLICRVNMHFKGCDPIHIFYINSWLCSVHLCNNFHFGISYSNILYTDNKHRFKVCDFCFITHTNTSSIIIMNSYLIWEILKFPNLQKAATYSSMSRDVKKGRRRQHCNSY